MGLVFTILLAGLFGLVWWLVTFLRTTETLGRHGSPLRNDRIDAMSARLAQAAGIDHLGVNLFDSPIVNAFATADARIFLTRGMFHAWRQGRFTDPELASVIAHELGHLALGHSRRRVIDVTAAYMIQSIVGLVLGRFLATFGWMLANRVANLFVAALSRKAEFEADAYATALMIRAGYGAAAQTTMLDKISRLSPAIPGGKVSWLASHPPVPDRISAIQANTQRWQP